MTETCNCDVCELEFEEEDVRHIQIKGKVKDICTECVDSIKGLM